MHQELDIKSEAQTQKRGFSINNLLAPHMKTIIESRKQTLNMKSSEEDEDDEIEAENSTGRDSSTSTDQPEDEESMFENAQLISSFNPLLIQHLSQTNLPTASLVVNSNAVGTSQSTANLNSQANGLRQNQLESSDFGLNSKLKVQSSDNGPTNLASIQLQNQSSRNSPTNSNQLPGNQTADWYNAVNYLNIATRQLQFMSNTPNAWDPRFAWLQPYIPKTQQKRKGGQIRFTNEQTDALEHTFDNNKYLSNVQRRKLAKTLSLSERQVKTWFQNRRAKWRRVRKDGEDEEDFHGMLNATTPTTPTDLTESFDSSLRQNIHSNDPAAQVASLFHSNSSNKTQSTPTKSESNVLAAAAAVLAQRGRSNDLFGMFSTTNENRRS
ncbi:Homeobox domain protein [Aphelenchoides besseyi]|nr:Homeobox domain protein [Aphelenchoides besseyi]KAI6202030.1 Homeobox domain protein [Aphelenchoides besseyi]